MTLPTTSTGSLSSSVATAAVIASSSSSTEPTYVRASCHRGQGKTMNPPTSSTRHGSMPPLRDRPKPMGNPFLYSEEHSRENEDSGELRAEEAERASACSSRHDNNTMNRPSMSNWQNWPRRHMHRSMSMDDMLEYQQQFSPDSYCSFSGLNVPEANFALDLADHRQEFQHFFAEHTPLSSTTEDRDLYNHIMRSKGSWDATLTAVPFTAGGTPKKISRKSIANSDLNDFKRQQSQKGLEGKTKTLGAMPLPETNKDDAESSSNIEKASSEEESTNTTSPPAGIVSGEYQWGTQSLPKSMLGSDLTKFQKSVTTALLVSSRESSCDSFDVGTTADQSSEKESQRREDTCDKALQQQQPDFFPTHSLKEENWGTRSLRRAIQQLDTFEDYSYKDQNKDQSERDSHSRRCETVLEDSKEEQDFISYMRSPWHDDDNVKTPKEPKKPSRVTSDEHLHLDKEPTLKRPLHNVSTQGASAEGLKMPKRLTPRGSPVYELGQRKPQHDRDFELKKPQRVVSDEMTYSNISPSSANTASQLAIASEEPEFRRTLLRRSISSSDIEKYQRHPTDNNNGGFHPSVDHHIEDEIIRKDNQAELYGQESTDTSTRAESSQFARATSTQFFHGMDIASLMLDGNEHAPPKADIRKKHRHRRSTSDVPELHMEETIADIAPRKPRRTNSADDCAGPPERFVRFAVDRTTVVEIPKVTEEMKPMLFYTKRDVKRFRMNEHRRQELQIRDYMEYLNQKQDSLEFGSPAIFE